LAELVAAGITVDVSRPHGSVAVPGTGTAASRTGADHRARLTG
jgi:hypothetical protein